MMKIVHLCMKTPSVNQSEAKNVWAFHTGTLYTKFVGLNKFNIEIINDINRLFLVVLEIITLYKIDS